MVLEDVGVNLNGIKSKELYAYLRDVVENKDYTVFDRVNSRDFLPLLLFHMCETIPKELFQQQANGKVKEVEDEMHGGTTDADDDDGEEEKKKSELLMKDLERIREHLVTTFVEQGQYPFTIARICELCFDPFKYFKTYEMDKYVRALEKCCLVETPEHKYEMRDGDDKDANLASAEQNDVALTKIPWIDDKMAATLTPFIKEIDQIMSVNLTFDEEMEEEEEEQERLRRAKALGEQDEDFLVEEYYEDEDMEEAEDGPHTLNKLAEDDDDEEDDDYVEEDEEDGDDEDDEDEDDGEDITEQQGADITKRKQEEEVAIEDDLNNIKRNKTDEST